MPERPKLRPRAGYPSSASIWLSARLVGDRIVDAVSLKITKLGGLRNAVSAARICEAGGAHVGTRLLNAHAIHLAAALPGVDCACEVGEFARMGGDPIEGIEVAEGRLVAPDRPGCGVTPVRALQPKQHEEGERYGTSIFESIRGGDGRAHRPRFSFGCSRHRRPQDGLWRPPSWSSAPRKKHAALRRAAQRSVCAPPPRSISIPLTMLTPSYGRGGPASVALRGLSARRPSSKRGRGRICF